MTAKNASRRPKGDGTIFEKNGRYIARVTYRDSDGITKRAQASGSTKQAAAAELKKLRDRIAAGKPLHDGVQPFGDFASDWITGSLSVSDRKPSTKALYSTLARKHIIRSTLGKTPCGKLRPGTVEKFIQELRARGLAESTVRQIYTVARAIADAAVRDGQMATNPFGQVKRPKVQKKEAEFLTADEVDRLLEAAAGSRYGLLFDFLSATALRRGEALALRWGDVNVAETPKEKPRIPAQSARIRGTLARIDGELVVGEPKTATSTRTIPLSDEALDVLRLIARRQKVDRLAAGTKWVDTGFVFTTEFGEPCDPRNALRALTRAAEKAGLPRVGLHTLRHSAATIMLNNGVPLAVVSKLLGHASIQVTVDIYGHEDEDATRQAFAALSAARQRARAIR